MSYTNEFIRAFGSVLRNEGGLVDDPDDPGGRTIYGLTSRDHADLWADGTPTLDQVAERYLTDYWDKLGLSAVKNAAVREEIFDTAILMGPDRAARIAQEALRDLSIVVAVDGAMGPLTRSALNNYEDQAVLFTVLNGRQLRHLIAIGNPKYLRGWIAKRVTLSPGG